jgi:PPE family
VTREDLEVTRWRGFTHAELYAQLHDGPGAAASATPSRRWADLASTLHDISQDMAKAVSDAKSSWAGKAADNAFAQLGVVAAWASKTGDAAEQMRLSVEQQADHIGRARAAMPAPGEEPTPQPDPLLAPVTQLLDMQKDHEAIERATTDAARRAFEVMKAYQDDTTSTTDELSLFDDPVQTKGEDAHGRRNRGGILDFVQQVTAIASAGPGPGPDHHNRPWWWGGGNGEPSRGAQHVSQSSAAFFGPEPETRFRAPAAPLQAGAMTGVDPIGTPATATPQREPSGSRKTPSTGKISGTLASVDTTPIPPGAAPHANAVTPATAATAPAGSSADRVTPRRVGEPLIPSQWTDDAVEPANQAKRRRDRAEQEKITESVDGAENEVPPPVIGTGPYRQ